MYREVRALRKARSDRQTCGPSLLSRLSVETKVQEYERLAQEAEQRAEKVRDIDAKVTWREAAQQWRWQPPPPASGLV